MKRSRKETSFAAVDIKEYMDENCTDNIEKRADKAYRLLSNLTRQVEPAGNGLI